MSMCVIFVCSGLLIYWMFRVRMLLRGSQDEIETILTNDLWTARRLILSLRALFQEPMQMA